LFCTPRLVSSRFCLVLADPSLGPCHRGVRRTFSASPPLSPLLAPEAFDAGRPRARSDLFLAARKGWNLPLSLPSHPSSPTVVIVTCFGLGNWANPHRPPSRNPIRDTRSADPTLPPIGAITRFSATRRALQFSTSFPPQNCYHHDNYLASLCDRCLVRTCIFERGIISLPASTTVDSTLNHLLLLPPRGCVACPSQCWRRRWG
jgi:hypothetical protein